MRDLKTELRNKMNDCKWRTVYFAIFSAVFLLIACRSRAVPFMFVGCCYFALAVSLWKKVRMAKTTSTVVLWLLVGMTTCSLPTALMRLKHPADIVGLIPGLIVLVVIPVILLILKK